MIRNPNKKIYLQDGSVALVTSNREKVIVDVDTLNIIGDSRIYFDNRYVRFKRNKKRFFLHKLVCPSPIGMVTDHINGNRLDNRRINLRIATKSQNQYNQRIQKKSKTGFKGVLCRGNKFISEIYYEGRVIYLGTFADKILAAKAYNNMAKILFGKFCRLNDIALPSRISCGPRRGKGHFVGGKN